METQTMLAQGTLLRNGTYRVEKQLSSGGFGNTYKVRNTAFDEVYAMKEFFMRGVNMRAGNVVTVSVPDNHSSYDSQKEKFKKEALRLRKLNNPHIVQVHDMFEENGTAYYIMDFIDGQSVSERLKTISRPMTEEETLLILPQVLGALKEVHAQSIWHLDIKPGNIMLDSKGNAFLIDFGASKQLRSDGGQTSSALCYTPGFAPMEQVEQDMEKFGPWTDFYALGATLYYMLTMKQPPSSAEIMESEPFKFPESVSTKMQDLIKWMMQPQRKNRPQSVDDIQKKLAEIPNEGTATVVNNTKSTKSEGTKPSTAGGVRIDGNNGSVATTLSSDNTYQSKAKSGGSAWKIIVPLIIVALLGVGAYFLFFNKSELQKRAEAHQDEYQEMVEDCDRLISKADDSEDFEKIKKMFVNIEDMEDVYAKALPEVYNMSDELKSQLKDRCKVMKRQFMSLASDAFDDDDYRTAYENYKLAAEMDPNDDDITSKINYLSSLLGYVYVTDLDFSNSEADGTDIDEAGTTLYASRMRYLWPRITYTSLLDDGDSSQKIEYYVKIFDPRGNLEHGTNSPTGYTYKGEYTIEPDEVGYRKWLRGWGNAEQSNFETGTYRFEMWHDGGLVYKGSVTLH